MAASDWEEIKRLAADFQRAQLSSTAHKLSERNCIEIVNKLISLGLLDIIYTTDGKEYLTPQELEKEIRDEVIVHGGIMLLFFLFCFKKLLSQHYHFVPLLGFWMNISCNL